MPSYRSLRNLGFGVAAAIPLSLASMGQAQAVPYAYASNVDSNFAITAVSGGTYTPSAGSFQTQNSITSNGFLPNASSFKTGNGFNTSDAPQVYSGPAANKPAENTFTQALLGVTSPALRADSLDTGFAGVGANVAEGNFEGGPPGGAGSGFGKLNSNNTSRVSVSVGAGTVLLVSFNDNVGLQTSVRPLADETAAASISSSVTIVNSAGVTVFSFTPNGQNTGVTGGTALTDPYNLNTNVASSGGGSLSSSYFRSGGLFSANTDALAAGTYTININQQSNIDLTLGTPAPEPASMAILGAGLIGLGVFRRNRKAS